MSAMQDHWWTSAFGQKRKYEYVTDRQSFGSAIDANQLPPIHISLVVRAPLGRQSRTGTDFGRILVQPRILRRIIQGEANPIFRTVLN